ncbi:MAG: type IV pilus biogenesis/stability protein PilW [Neisseriaceae bacterium]|nr:type IV pilus biogenesis/stability protein PilW [Neisseriaceae bacterium]
MFRTVKTAFLLSTIALTASCALLPDTSGPSRSERQEDFAKVKTQLAIEYMKVGEYRQSIAAIDEAIKAKSNYDMAWLVRGVIHQNLKMNNEADQSFRRALSISPTSAEINNNYGWFLCDNMKQYAASIAYFDKALADPTYPQPYVATTNKGICKGRAGNIAEAAADLARAKALAPAFPTPTKEMARLKLMENQPHPARELMNQYQRQMDRLNADDLLLGWKISKALGDTQSAFEYEAQLRQQFPASNELQEIDRMAATARPAVANPKMHVTPLKTPAKKAKK